MATIDVKRGTATSVRTDSSVRLFARAQESIPGGVNSSVRAFTAVGGTPRFIERGEGANLFDAENDIATTLQAAAEACAAL